MFIIAHAGHPAHFFAGFVTGALLAGAFVLVRLMRRRL